MPLIIFSPVTGTLPQAPFRRRGMAPVRRTVARRPRTGEGGSAELAVGRSEVPLVGAVLADAGKFPKMWLVLDFFVVEALGALSLRPCP